MIQFSCSNCRMKFQVHTQFAGRTSRCPTCKQPLVVPPADHSTSIEAGEIAGTSSSVVQAGVDASVTVAMPVSGGSDQKSIRELLERRTKNGERYIVEGEIARGGMGVVLRAVDCDIRREVAIKYMLAPTDPHKKARFVEEAQITGQLEHPNIVPIHELAVDAQKRLFFSMKMVKGRSLAQVLSDLQQKPTIAEKEYALSRLLHVFINVCHALAYAHARGVVHRDLKPANIMLGDFGEVYVMDWGLAKVRGSGVDEAPSTVPVAAGPRPVGNTAVVVSRDVGADLTQEGSILGTPAYMSPEQAAGHLHAVDARSDVYSLGAILYELLTLHPPVDREGGYLNVLMRVMEGQVIPPAQRDSQRAQQGKIPPELEAIAMKALAKEPSKRYENVEALRRDIERFLEGRSVSARPDSVREFAWKLVKRNKAVSIVTAAAAVVLLFVWARGAWINYQEQRERHRQAEKSVPAFVEAAHFAIEQGKLDHALVQIDVAVEYAPKNAEVRLLRSHLLTALGDFPAACADLSRYLELKPEDADAAQLLQLCQSGRKDDAATAAAIAEIFRRQNQVSLAISMIRSREQLLTLYRHRIASAWGEAAAAGLEMDKDGKCKWICPASTAQRITDLSPLKGMPLTELNLSGCPHLQDLGPLRGMPLNRLTLNGCTRIDDLTPLQGLPLTRLSLQYCGLIRDLRPLQGMQLAHLSLFGCDKIKDLTPLKGMPLVALDISWARDIRDLTPLQDLSLQTLAMRAVEVRSVAPLTRMPLRWLDLASCGVRDLSPLKNMPLAYLDLTNCVQIDDLSALSAMPLQKLVLDGCSKIKDLTPLRGRPLTALNISKCMVRDLTPLKGMKITRLRLHGCSEVHDLTPLQGMPLEVLGLSPKYIKVGMKDLRPMKTLREIWLDSAMPLHPATFWKKYDAGEFNK